MYRAYKRADTVDLCCYYCRMLSSHGSVYVTLHVFIFYLSTLILEKSTFNLGKIDFKLGKIVYVLIADEGGGVP